jgi:WD40 repeat protein
MVTVRRLKLERLLFWVGGALGMAESCAKPPDIGDESALHGFSSTDGAAAGPDDADTEGDRTAAFAETSSRATDASVDASSWLDGPGDAGRSGNEAEADGSPAPNCDGWGTSTTSVAVARSGFVATGFADGSAIVRSASLALTRKIQAHQGSVQGIGVSDDGALLVTLGDGEIRTWNLTNGQRVGSVAYIGPAEITEFSMSPDGQSLIALGASQAYSFQPPFQPASSWSVTVYDLGTPALAWQGSETGVTTSAFFCDGGQNVCVVHGGDLTVHRRTDGQAVRTYAAVKGVPSPDGSILVSHSSGPDTLDITRTSDGVPTHQPSMDTIFDDSFLFSGDGSVLTNFSDIEYIRAWLPPSYTQLDSWMWSDASWQNLQGNLPAWRIVSGPGPNLLFDDLAGKVGLVDATTGQFGRSVATLGQQGVPEVIRVSPDGTLVATLAGFNPTPFDHYEPPTGPLVLWDAITHAALWSAPLAPTKGGLQAVAFSPDSKLVYTDAVRDARDGHLIRSLTGGTGCYAPTPDGSLLYTCGYGPYPIEAYDLMAGTQRTMDGGFAAFATAIAPNAKSLVIAIDPERQGDPMRLRMYTLPDEERGWVTDAGEWALAVDPSIVFSPDSTLLALTKPFSPGLRLFDAATGHLTAVLEPNDPLGPVAFSPDSRYLAAATSRGIDLIRIADRQVAQTLPWASAKPLDGSRPVGVAFSPRGDQLFVGNGSGHIATFCKVLDQL